MSLLAPLEPNSVIAAIRAFGIFDADQPLLAVRPGLGYAFRKAERNAAEAGIVRPRTIADRVDARAAVEDIGPAFGEELSLPASPKYWLLKVDTAIFVGPIAGADDIARIRCEGSEAQADIVSLPVPSLMSFALLLVIDDGVFARAGVDKIAAAVIVCGDRE